MGIGDEKMKLTKTQKKVLLRMKAEEWYTAYDLNCSIATLRSLSKKEYLESKTTGYMAFPRNSIYFKNISERK